MDKIRRMIDKEYAPAKWKVALFWGLVVAYLSWPILLMLAAFIFLYIR